jgi:hypothetical protein
MVAGSALIVAGTIGAVASGPFAVFSFSTEQLCAVLQPVPSSGLYNSPIAPLYLPYHPYRPYIAPCIYPLYRPSISIPCRCDFWRSPTWLVFVVAAWLLSIAMQAHRNRCRYR